MAGRWFSGQRPEAGDLGPGRVSVDVRPRVEVLLGSKAIDWCRIWLASPSGPQSFDYDL